MKEIWKPIAGHEGLYEINIDGQVRSIRRNKILRNHLDKDGYWKVTIYLPNRMGQKVYLVHRLIALAFIPNPNNHPIINHKDENPSNNHIDNLEWCTYTHNNLHGGGMAKRIAQTSKPVEQLDLGGNLIQVFPSLNEASRQLGIGISNIAAVCHGKRRTIKGYIFKFCKNK